MLKQIEKSITEFIDKGMANLDEDNLFAICEDRALMLLKKDNKLISLMNVLGIANMIMDGVLDADIEIEYQKLIESGVHHDETI